MESEVSILSRHFFSPGFTLMRTEVHNSNVLVTSMAGGDERAAACLYDEFSPVLFALAL